MTQQIQPGGTTNITYNVIQMTPEFEKAIIRLANTLTNTLLEGKTPVIPGGLQNTSKAPESTSTSDSSETPAPKKKRRRRTKEQIEADRAAEARGEEPSEKPAEVTVEKLRKIVLEWQQKANANVSEIGKIFQVVKPGARGIDELSVTQRAQVYRIFEEKVNDLDNPEGGEEEDDEFKV